MIFLKILHKSFILRHHISSMILCKRNFKITCHKIKKTLQEDACGHLPLGTLPLTPRHAQIPVWKTQLDHRYKIILVLGSDVLGSSSCPDAFSYLWSMVYPSLLVQWLRLRAWVRSLVGELRTHMPQTNKQTKNRKNKATVICGLPSAFPTSVLGTQALSSRENCQTPTHPLRFKSSIISSRKPSYDNSKPRCSFSCPPPHSPPPHR